MLYKTKRKLPPAIKNTLPQEAQEIYKNAYNSAWDNYDDPSKRREGSREEVSHRVAWAAVKKKYIKVNDSWEPKD